MATHVTDPTAAAAAAPTLHLASYRRHILAIVVGCPPFTAAEKSQALFKLPTLTHSGAVFLLGRLYAKAYLRTGQRLGTDGQGNGLTPLAQ